MLNETQLLELKEEIEESKAEIQRLEGRLESLLSQLKEDYECESIEDAEALLEEKTQEVEELEKKIKLETQELEDKYDFD